MNISILESSPRAREVAFSDPDPTVYLKDGRAITVPLRWFPRLLNATPEQSGNFELLGDFEGIHWPMRTRT